MKQKLSRLDILEYCNKCQHVKKTLGGTVCGLTNKMATFDYECNKFTSKEAKVKTESKKHYSVGPPIFGIVFTLLKIVLDEVTHSTNPIFYVVLLISFVWLIVTLIYKKNV